MTSCKGRLTVALCGLLYNTIAQDKQEAPEAAKQTLINRAQTLFLSQISPI